MIYHLLSFLTLRSGFPRHFTFDRFHVVKPLNEAMDTVCKQEHLEYDALKGHKYTFLINPEKLSTKKQDELAEMITLHPTLGEAYRLKVLFNELWEMSAKQAEKIFIQLWFCEVELSGIRAFINFSKTVKAHLAGIINFLETHITNAILESINNKIQMAKRRARGYQNIENFTKMIYFLCGKLKFNYPLYSS